tara:strand:+ start:609 stop:1055 length:447 start_codon:yes stop_codon:yes gene_type:complete
VRKRKSKTKVPVGYDSKLECDLHKNELKNLTYHPEEKISYVTKHTYEPDFLAEIPVQQGQNKTVLIEVKGRFRERKEASKYISIRESFAQDEEKELIFLFQDADKPMPFAQRRKDGTKQTHGEWAAKNGFRFYCLKKGLPKKWLQELK